MNYCSHLRRCVADWLHSVAMGDIRSGKEPMRYAQPPTETTTGRYVSLRIDMGFSNDRFQKLLTDRVVNQLIPWDIGKQKPQVYDDRKFVVIEAPLPQHAQKTNIPLSRLSGNRHSGRVAILGPNETGTTISLGLNDIIHALIGGQTGAGKSWTMRMLLYQLASGNNKIVLADAKRGDGLGIVNGVPGQVGPLAVERDDIVNALGWVYDEMNARYDVVSKQRNGMAWRDDDPKAPAHLLLFFDEFQALRDDDVVMKLMHGIASMGRSARVHLFAGTQRPTVKMFGRDVGGATRDQFGTRIAHSVQSYKSSEAIIGNSEPRADYLLMHGDAYVIANRAGFPIRERVQFGSVPEIDLRRFANGEPDLDEWPEYDPGDLSDGPGRPPIEFDNVQIACSVYAANQRGWGRGRLQGLLDEMGVPVPGATPADRLLGLGREIKSVMGEIEEKREG